MDRRHLPLLLAALLAPAHAWASNAPPTDNPRRSALDKAIDTAASTYFAETCHAGLSIAAVTPEGTRIYGYGYADRGKRALPKPDSLYEIASVTKSFTASLAAYAVHEGKMALDADFRAYLGGAYPNLAKDGNPVTLATLLTHRSNMPRDIPDSDAIFNAKDPRTLPAQLIALNKGRDEKDFLRDLHATALRSTPGSEERYSNAGYQLIGVGLEHVYGKRYDALLQQRILAPLGMASTTLAPSQAQRSRRVTPYDMFGRPAPEHPANAGAAWGLWSTPTDLAKYVRWQLDGNDAVVALSHRPLVHGDGEDVAMAWHVETIDGKQLISHGGGSFGTSSQIVLFPASHHGYALLANDSCKGTEGALKAIAMAAEAQATTTP
jgi:serine-type D-Ala-D-Ala carboxypeptidase/endopeptidase